MANFTYLVGSLSKRQCMVVDPAWDIKAIVDAAEADGMTITGALVTHYHPDHCGGHLWGHDIQGIAELIATKHVPIYVQADEANGVMTVTGVSKNDLKICRSGDQIDIGGVGIKVIHTPGHTPGSQCFLCEDRLISGDTLFISGCGRVDLPGGNPDQMYDSLTNKLAKLPPQTILLPGHNYDPVPTATMAEVKARNPYLQATSLAAWRGTRGV